MATVKITFFVYFLAVGNNYFEKLGFSECGLPATAGPHKTLIERCHFGERQK